MMYRWSINRTTFIALTSGRYQTSRGLFTVGVQSKAYYNDAPIWEKLL